MSKERELLQRVLNNGHSMPIQIIYEIEELLKEPEQEPAAWMYERQNEDFTERTLSVGFEKNFDGITIPLYASPPKRKPLSEDEIDKAYQESCRNYYDLAFKDGVRFAEQHYGITGERNNHYKERRETFGESDGI